MSDYPEAARPLAELEGRHDYFVGIDTDGCAFDTMEPKRKECFTPDIIRHWVCSRFPGTHARRRSSSTCTPSGGGSTGGGPW